MYENNLENKLHFLSNDCATHLVQQIFWGATSVISLEYQNDESFGAGTDKAAIELKLQQLIDDVANNLLTFEDKNIILIRM